MAGRLPPEMVSMDNCAYCGRPADEDGCINHEGGCDGLKSVAINQLQHDMLTSRIRKLEIDYAVLAELRRRNVVEWKYLDDGVTLMRGALQCIPEIYRDGDPNPLHYAIKEWLARPERANASQSDALEKQGDES